MKNIRKMYLNRDDFNTIYVNCMINYENCDIKLNNIFCLEIKIYSSTIMCN